MSDDVIALNDAFSVEWIEIESFSANNFSSLCGRVVATCVSVFLQFKWNFMTIVCHTLLPHE